ncbi:MAG: hypothetical protein DMG89_11365 [Acidobacteria bacterium]|nr:MAG: hypothetical protein DMG89_11365 [Acidobacteriota bacterium]
MKAFTTNRVASALFVLVLIMPALAADVVTARPSLDTGFKLLYSLDFDRAHDFFSAWQREHPEDPMGHVCEAAGVLFSEFNRLGILEGQFYANDKVFETRKKLSPDPAARDRFNAALERAEKMARAQVAKNPKDRDSLFALTLATGLRADYAALIEKRNLASLHYTKESTAWAQQLLAVDPQCYDAHLATGISRYIIGSMAAPVRWILRLGGISGDKRAGIEELRLTADRGQYLAPFARILLAIAYVREKDNGHAREVLASLRDEFPSNPLFAREIARLDSGH